MKEYMILRPCIYGDEIKIQLIAITDIERVKILQSFLNKTTVNVTVLGIETECYITLISINKVNEP